MGKWLSFIALALLLNACSFVQTKPIDQASVIVDIVGQDRIRFSGKGAGAGMMMSASMGAMGIAIGVAIDEGIGKDIHESFTASGSNFSGIVKAETDTWLIKACEETSAELEILCRSVTNLTIRIYRYGFVIASGDGDPVKPELDIGFVIGDQEELRLNLKDSDDQRQTAKLDVVKKGGVVSSALLKNGYQFLLEQYQNQGFSADQ